MEKFIRRDIDLQITDEALLKRLRMAEDPEVEDCLKVIGMLKDALACAKPKFVYGLAAIEEKGENYVVVAGRRILSPLVRKNLDKVNRIFPYVATCGVEVELWSRQFTDMLEHFWADEIKLMMLENCFMVLNQTVKDKYFASSDMSRMNPGSLPAWPITAQAVLFDILGNPQEDVGVSLTDSCLMIPSKSISGFFFSSESHFENCGLCPRMDCPNRKAIYQPSGGTIPT